MKTIKFVKLPGEIREFVVETGTTVNELLKLAGFTGTAEMSVMGDDEVIGFGDTVDNFELITVTKKLKGAK